MNTNSPVFDEHALSPDFEKLISSMTQGFALHKIVCDHTGAPVDYIFLYVNSAFEKITGLKSSEMTGKNVKSFFPGLESFWIDTYGKVAISGEPISFEHYTAPMDAWFEVTAYSPGKNFFACIFSEITGRKKTEEKLRLFEAIIESSNEAIAIGKPDGKLVYTNLAHEKLFGMSRQKAVTSNFTENLPSRSVDVLKKAVIPLLRDGKSWQGEIDAFDSGGKVFELWSRADALRNENGTIQYVFGLMHDVSETKRINEARLIAEEKLRAFISNVDDAIYYISLDGHMHCYNPACYRFSGYTSEDFNIDPKLWQKIMHPDDLKEILDLIDKKPESFVFKDLEFRSKYKNGEWRWINTRITPAFSSEGVLSGYNCIGRDITRSKRVETILRMSGRISSMFITKGQDQIFRHVLDYLLDCFKAQTGFIAYFPDSANTFILSASPDDIFEVCRTNERMWKGINICAQSICEKKIIYRNSDLELPAGHIIVDNAISTPIIIGNNVIALLVIANSNCDFTKEDRKILKALGTQLAPIIESHMKTAEKEKERLKLSREKEKLEQQIRQAQKIEAVGQLAGGMAHDLNNMLSPILGFSELLIADFGENQELLNGLTEIRKAAERAKDLVKHLLAFSRKQVLDLMTEDVNYIISRMERMLRHVVLENIKVDFILAGYPIYIMVDRGQIEQIVLNLVLNAQDAMKGGGLLSISTDMIFIDKTDADHDEKKQQPGNYALIEIRDTGSGMSPEVMEHIFEPFYTTKPVGQGSGLGLATVYGIVNQHNGFIEVQSEQGRGSTFRIFFPVADGTDSTGGSEEVTDYGIYGTETIIVVEDNEMVRFFVEHVLKRHGFNVLVAESPVKGLEIIESYPATINLMLTDIIMPEMSGQDLLKNARKLKPNIKCVYMTGYGEDVLSGQGLFGNEGTIITKPFTIAELISAVRNELDN